MNGLIEEIENALKQPFSLQNFFSYSSHTNHCASVVITSKQALTIPNIFNYAGPHPLTQQLMIQKIYNLPDTSINSNSNAQCKRLLNSAIRMDLINDPLLKLIVIHLPDKISKGQIDLLNAYQNTYGEIVECISKNYNQESEQNAPIVFFTKDGKDCFCHSFEEAVKHAQTLPKVEKIDTPDEIILGSILSQDKSVLSLPDSLISLKVHLQQALAKRNYTSGLFFIIWFQNFTTT